MLKVYRKTKRKKWIFKNGSRLTRKQYLNWCVCSNDSAIYSNDSIFIFGLIVCQFLSLLTPTFAAKDIPVYHVTAIRGEPVFMPCDISTSDEGDAVVIVLWYREDLGTPIYTVDTRDRPIAEAERWSADSVFANRAYFMPEKNPAELGVDHVRESDAGVYRCRVDFTIGQTRNTKVNLTVIVPPYKIVITDESGAEKNSVVGPYYEEAQLRLKCDVYGGKPKPSVQWWRGAENVGKSDQSLGSQVRSELLIENLKRGHLNSEFTCRAFNNNKTSPLASTIRIEMHLPPLNVRILESMESLSAGRRYDLLCQSSGSRPPATVTWWKEGRQLENAKESISSDGNTTTSTLSYVPSKDDGGKYLYCRSFNSHLPSAKQLETQWKLQIQYVPKCEIELGKSLDANAVKEGSDVYFDCLIDAQPPVYKVEWRHNGRPLNHNVTQGIIITNQSLVLQGVSRSSAGNYSCAGFNEEGESESSPFHLNVLYAPTCKPSQMRVHGIAKAEKAVISCSVDANPPDVTFKWLFNNSAESLDVASSHIAKSGTVSTVSYTPRTEMDYGTLLCWARNSIGDQKVPCVFHIIAAGRPDPVVNCTASNISASSFYIKCTEGFSGGLPQSFLMEVLRTTTQGIEKNTTSPFPRFNVGDLEAGNSYHVFVYAFNKKGRSEPVVLQAYTLHGPEKHLASEKEPQKYEAEVDPFVIMGSAIGGALFLTAAAVALLLRIKCFKPSDNNGKLPKMKFDRIHTSPGKPNQNGRALGIDADEKNPDVIPQPDAGGGSESKMDCMIKRQSISTIETDSPVKHVLASSFRGSGPQGFCKNWEDVSHFQGAVMNELSYAQTDFTTPRHYWTKSLGRSRQRLFNVNPPNLSTGVVKINQVFSSKDDSNVSFGSSRVESTV